MTNSTRAVVRYAIGCPGSQDADQPVELHAHTDDQRHCCINACGGSWLVERSASGCDLEDIEQLVHETDLVFDMRLTRETVSSADHAHDFEAFDRGVGRLMV
jgi:hypothetical protein